MARFCNQCGTKAADGAAFCGNCGLGLAAVAATPPDNAATYAAAPVSPQGFAAPPQRPISTINPLWVLVGLVIVALAGAVIYMFATRDSAADDAKGTDATQQIAATEGPALGPEVTKYIVSTTNIRNVATAEGPQSRVVGTLQRGMQVRGVMHQGLVGNSAWLKLADGRGYVTAVNLSDGPPAPEEPVARAPIPNASYCVVATFSGNLRIRSSPAGRIVGGMPRGARFQAFDTQYDNQGFLWAHIQPVERRYPVGWVSADHVSC